MLDYKHFLLRLKHPVLDVTTITHIAIDRRVECNPALLAIVVNGTRRPKGKMTKQKADFENIYVEPDPGSYHRTLGNLDYEIPEHGRRVFHALLDELRVDSEDPTVLDLCCSYGVNAALLNHDVTLEEVQAHHSQASALSHDDLLERDRRWYADRRRSETVNVIGLDSSEAAVNYAVDAGLLTDGITADLETGALTEQDQTKISDVDLVTVTGGIGYIADRTFDHILQAFDQTPWVAALSLRWVDFEPVAETLDSHGLVTEKVDDFVVPQRRFSSSEERNFVFGQLSTQGLTPSEIEENGQHSAELYVARPAHAATDIPLHDILDQVIDGSK